AEGRLHFFGDSEGRIVRGLLAVLLTAVEGKTRAGILAQDPLAAKLRERLKSQFGVVKNSKGKLGVDCVFSTEALVYPQA
ncbi:SufE family protein, partial [Klebsiella pneumoniae]|uniref:SufE family protein n=1 Tax=Klebsiella pneumoniae TaxID=573 RepID=UPI001F173627